MRLPLPAARTLVTCIALLTSVFSAGVGQEAGPVGSPGEGDVSQNGGSVTPSPATSPTATSPTATSPATTSPATTRVAVPLPTKWHGKYVGELEASSADRPGAVQKVPAELTIAPIEGTPDVLWTLHYTVPGQPVRKYMLKAVPGFPGRHLMDENNGILIDHALVGDKLMCQFTASGALLTSSFELRDGGVYFEVMSSNLTKPRRTNAMIPGANFVVESYPLRNVQRGLLKRVTE
jgi:hypothetical protein